jgi:shikimate kinase
MGAGKTTVGEALARRTGWPFLDNDRIVEELAGSSKRTLLDTQGEAALRSYERLALDRVLSNPAPLIGSVAGGALLDPEAADELNQSRDLDSFVVWLRVPHATLIERLTNQPDDRPWLQGDPTQAVVRLAAKREPVFARCADRVIDTLGRAPDEVAEEIVSALDLDQIEQISPGALARTTT